MTEILEIDISKIFIDISDKCYHMLYFSISINTDLSFPKLNYY